MSSLPPLPTGMSEQQKYRLPVPMPPLKLKPGPKKIPRDPHNSAERTRASNRSAVQRYRTRKAIRYAKLENLVSDLCELVPSVDNIRKMDHHTAQLMLTCVTAKVQLIASELIKTPAKTKIKLANMKFLDDFIEGSRENNTHEQQVGPIPDLPPLPSID